jgi:beta-lactamase class A
MKNINLKFAIVIIIVFLCTPLSASDSVEHTVFTRLFSDGPSQVAYTTQFQHAVPLETMMQILEQIQGQVGTFVAVEGSQNPYTLYFSEGTVTAYISLDTQGRMAGLQFTEIIPSKITLKDAVSRIVEMEGPSSILIQKNGKSLISHLIHTPLAVGSTFKLAVLAALDDAIQKGELSWNHVVTVQQQWKSLPTGILQDWPEGTHITLETLATLMISLSDNTATDALIKIVGKPSIEKYLSHSLPMLTTGEAFRLKNPTNEKMLTAYRKASQEKRIQILDQLTTLPLPDASLFTSDPVALDVEWFMTTAEIGDLLKQLAPLNLMTINPGVATDPHWQRVVYKGGSEPGVLQLSTLLIDSEGNQYIVSITVNNEEGPIDETTFVSAYQTILHQLKTL